MSRHLHWAPRLSQHLMAFGWSAALLATLASLIVLPVPFWLLALAYLLPALLRQAAPRLSILAAALVAASSALLVPPTDIFFAALLLLAQSARPLTLSRQPSVTFLRIEQKRGMALLLLVVLMRAAAGRPSAWLIALCAVLYLVGALGGLPLAHSRESGDAQPSSASHGLRISLVIGAGAAVIAAVIGAIRLAAAHHLFDFLQPLFAAIFRPIAYVLGLVVQFFIGLLLRRKPHIPPQKEKHTKPQAPHFAQHTYSAGFLHHLEFVLAIAAVLVLALVVYMLYRRLEMQEAEETGDPNAPGPGDDLAREAVRRRRGAADYGEGARRMVRRTVGIHLHGRPLPPGTTARGWAKSQGWEDELLAAYEHARYGFVEPFPESKARAFVSSFVRRFGRRGPRSQDRT